MLYKDVSSKDGKHRVITAESSGLRNWNKLGLVLDVGDEGQCWAFNGVGASP